MNRDQVRITEMLAGNAKVLIQLTDCVTGQVYFRRLVPIYDLSDTLRTVWNLIRSRHFECVQ